MATGRCTNIMKRCSKAINKEIQEADKANFVCSECGKPLMEVNGIPTVNDDDNKNGHSHGTKTPPPPHGGKGKLYAMIAAAVVIIVIAIIFLMKKEKTEEGPTGVPPTNISLSKDRSKIFVGETDTLQAILGPEGATAQLKWATSDTTIIKVVDGVVTAVSHGTAKVGVQVVENKELKAFCEYTVKEKPGKGPQPGRKVFSGAATLSGNTITFQHAYTLDLQTMEGEELSIGRGDRIEEAKIKNGYLMSGIYVSSTGDERYISGLHVKL